MKRGIYELVMVGALAALAGCSSATLSAPPISPTSVQMRDYIDARKKVVETLKASRITAKVQLCASGSGETTFTFKGKGKGHVRGKVVAKGEWSFSSIGDKRCGPFRRPLRSKARRTARSPAAAPTILQRARPSARSPTIRTWRTISASCQALRRRM